MIETIFRTDDVPVEDRFDAFRESLSKVHAPMDVGTDLAGGFSAEMRFIQLSSVCVWPSITRPVHMQRTPRLIRKSDPEHYHLTLMLRGAKRLVQAGQESVCDRYNMHIVDTSRPFHVDTPGSGEFKVIGVEFPKTLVPFPRDRVDRLVTQLLPGCEGINGLLASFVIRLSRDTSSYRPSDAPRLETALTDLFSAVLAHCLDAETELSPETHQRTLILRIRSFIRQRLHDPCLTPATVGAAHHISTSYLHRLFRAHDEEGTTVAAWIRHQRLEAASRDLADPAQHTVAVHHIGRRWGFTHHAAFTRAFRAAYGVPPRDYRQAAAHLGANGPSLAAPSTPA